MTIDPAQTNETKVTSLADLSRMKQAQQAAKESTAAPTTTAVKDTVQISGAAEEAAETAAQTAQEANRGDQQAQRLVAKHAATQAFLQGDKQSSLLRTQ